MLRESTPYRGDVLHSFESQVVVLEVQTLKSVGIRDKVLKRVAYVVANFIPADIEVLETEIALHKLLSP